MTLNELYRWSKKIHRFSMWIMIFLSVVMAVTGSILGYQNKFNVLIPGSDFARYLHGEISIFFTIVIVLMTISGLGMYLLPEIIKRNAKQKTDS